MPPAIRTQVGAAAAIVPKSPGTGTPSEPHPNPPPMGVAPPLPIEMGAAARTADIRPQERSLNVGEKLKNNAYPCRAGENIIWAFVEE